MCKRNELLPSEALLGFIAWLSSRKEKTILSRKHTPPVKLYSLFCRENNLKPTRTEDKWHPYFKMPKEENT